MWDTFKIVFGEFMALKIHIIKQTNKKHWKLINFSTNEGKKKITELK